MTSFLFFLAGAVYGVLAILVVAIFASIPKDDHHE